MNGIQVLADSLIARFSLRDLIYHGMSHSGPSRSPHTLLTTYYEPVRRAPLRAS